MGITETKHLPLPSGTLKNEKKLIVNRKRENLDYIMSYTVYVTCIRFGWRWLGVILPCYTWMIIWTWIGRNSGINFILKTCAGNPYFWDWWPCLFSFFIYLFCKYNTILIAKNTIHIILTGMTRGRGWGPQSLSISCPISKEKNRPKISMFYPTK